MVEFVDLPDIRSHVIDAYGISKTQLEALYAKSKEKIKSFKERINHPIKIQQDDMDQFLYSFETLPVLGKEYWFMLFSGLNGSFHDQLMVAFGRNRKNNMQMNNVEQLPDTDYYRGGVSECWFVKDNRVNKLGIQPCKITIQENILEIKGENYDVQFSGNFPDYEIKIISNEQIIIQLSLQPPKSGKPFEFNQFFVGNLGFDLGNLYFDFQGKLSDEAFNGNSYVQKVIITAPFVPWYWSRLVFENGSWLLFFQSWIEFRGIKKQISSGARFYDVSKDREYEIEEFDFKQQNNQSWMDSDLE